MRGTQAPGRYATAAISRDLKVLYITLSMHASVITGMPDCMKTKVRPAFDVLLHRRTTSSGCTSCLIKSSEVKFASSFNVTTDWTSTGDRPRSQSLRLACIECGVYSIISTLLSFNPFSLKTFREACRNFVRLRTMKRNLTERSIP